MKMKLFEMNEFRIPDDIRKLETSDDKVVQKNLEELYLKNDDSETESLYFSRFTNMIHMEEMASLKRISSYDMKSMQLRLKSHTNRTFTIENKVIKNELLLSLLFT